MGVELAWACGLFEGEGSIHAGRKAPRGQPRSQRRLQLTIADRDVLDRFHAAVGGVGKVRAVKLVPGHKQLYTWYLYRTADILALLDEIEPMLGERRRAQAAKLRAAV